MCSSSSGICLVVAAFSIACFGGTRVEDFAPAHEPDGVYVTVNLRREAPVRRLRGELIAVGERDLVIRDLVGLWRVQLHAVTAVSSSASGTRFTYSGRQIERSRARQRLRLLSRYPQGISDDLLHGLLAAYGHDSLRTVP